MQQYTGFHLRQKLLGKSVVSKKTLLAGKIQLSLMLSYYNHEGGMEEELVGQIFVYIHFTTCFLWVGSWILAAEHDTENSDW